MYGIILGDGSMSSSYYNGYISLHTENKKTVIDFVKKYFQEKCVQYFVDKGNSDMVERIRWNKNIVLPFRHSDVYNSQKEKYIANKWLHLPIDKAKYIVKGLIDTDGCKNKEITFDNTSRLLIEGFRYLLLRMGILSSGYIQDRVGETHVTKYGSNITNQKVSYCLRIPKTEEIITLLGLPKENIGKFYKYFKYKKCLFSRVQSIEKNEYHGTLYDLQMNEVHDYMIHNGIIHNGGGKRNGSFAIYLEPWHADVEMFLQMRKNHGDEELKARDLFYALWVPDLFMKRVKEGKQWTLMCPSECPGLSDVIGDDFVTLYEKYETEGKGRSTIPARDLWFQILDSQMETGTPYLLFKDASNKKSNQQNLGVIKSSNLCVSPGTNILTSEGQYPIYSLWSGNYTEEERQKNKTVNVWNGKEFSAVEIVKTGEDVNFVDVHTSDGMVLTCTPYHKFYVRDGKKQTYIEDAQNLLPGYLLEESNFPVLDGPETFPDNIDPVQEGCDTGVQNVLMRKEPNQSLFVPINYNMKDKMLWLSGFIEPYVVKCIKEDSDMIRVPSISITFLEDLKYMLQTCGINTILHTFLRIETYTTHSSEHDSDEVPKAEWIITLVQLRYLKEANSYLNFKTFTWGFPLLTEEEKRSILMKPNVRILKVTPSDKVDDSYCFTEPISHAGIFNGIRTSQCTEIIEYSDENETAVCNLASIALPAFINKETNSFNFEELHKITRIVTRNLNKVIDINFYPTEKTKVSNMRHRPIGLGVQVLADVFFMLKLSFSSEEAKTINKYIFETIYNAALEESCLMSQEDGHYETFPGSPASNGLLQFDMWNVQPGNTRYDWDELKERIKLHGLRNSLLVAPMPTASTSQILGYNECIEPITSNIYSRRTLAGEFILVNKYLMQEMLEKDLWNETFKNHMVANNGSIQSIDYLSKELRERYRTVWEIPMKDLVDIAADRGAYICQSQSLNLWLEDPNYNTMTSMHFYSWQKGLKTGIYYLRRRPKHQAQQFTIEPNKQTIPREEEITCEMCSS